MKKLFLILALTFAGATALFAQSTDEAFDKAMDSMHKLAFGRPVLPTAANCPNGPFNQDGSCAAEEVPNRQESANSRGTDGGTGFAPNPGGENNPGGGLGTGGDTEGTGNPGNGGGQPDNPGQGNGPGDHGQSGDDHGQSGEDHGGGPSDDHTNHSGGGDNTNPGGHGNDNGGDNPGNQNH